MITSLVPKLVLCGLLVLTLSFKVLVRRSQLVSGQEQNELVRASMATFLARYGFQANSAIAIQYPISMSGRADGCQLLIAEVAFEGWGRDSLRRLVSGDDQFFFFFRGHKYEDQPIWLTRLSGYRSIFLQNLGLSATIEPVLGIVASPPCDLKAMRWRELADQIAALRR